MFLPHDEHEISLNRHSFSIVAQTETKNCVPDGVKIGSLGAPWVHHDPLSNILVTLFKGVKNDITTYKVANYVAYI